MDFLKKHKERVLGVALAAAFIALSPTGVLAATGAESTVKQILEKFIDVIVLIFQAIGVLLGVYSLGSLIMSRRNEDTEGMIRSGSTLVVAVLLVGIRPIINWLNLTSYIGK